MIGTKIFQIGLFLAEKIGSKDGNLGKFLCLSHREFPEVFKTSLTFNSSTFQSGVIAKIPLKSVFLGHPVCFFHVNFGGPWGKILEFFFYFLTNQKLLFILFVTGGGRGVKSSLFFFEGFPIHCKLSFVTMSQWSQCQSP